MKFPSEVHTKGCRCRAVVRTSEEALRLIDDELPAELRSASRWAFARELLLACERSGKKRDAVYAMRQLRQALANDDLLAEDAPVH
jgi:hypothetical protein